MNQRIKKLWIKALRSGKYPQGRRQLQDENGYCCFGVLERLAVLEGVVDLFRPSQRYLSSEVVSWAELPHYNPVVPTEVKNSEVPLAYLNDVGCDFNLIAERIEKYL